jgi:signal transduction histidine kinase
VDELRYANEAQHDFLAAASHQLRTPLTSIRLRLDELEAVGTGSPVAGESLGEIASEVERLETLTTRLLTLLAGSQASPAVVLPLRTIISESILRIAPFARSRHVRTQVAGQPFELIVVRHAGALEEVLLNVLDNAVKHTPEGGVVTVAVEDRANVVLLRVIDQGPGIEPDVLKKIFNPFFRSPRSSDGFGLGLTIAKRLCEISDGAISLGPHDDFGTVVTIEWPKAGAPQPMTNDGSPRSSARSRSER